MYGLKVTKAKEAKQMNNKIRNLAIITVTYLLGVFTSGWYLDLESNFDEKVTEVKPYIETEQQTKKTLEKENNLNKLIESNQQLELQVSQLTEQLSESKIAHQSPAEEENKIPKNKTSSFMKMMTPDFLKSTLAMQLSPVTSELTHTLNLSDEQSKSLADLLKKKAEADIDANTKVLEKMVNGDAKEMIEDSLSGKQDESDAGLAAKELMAINQRDYQQKLMDIISEEQLEQYQAFEQDKQQQQYQMAMNMQSNMTMSQIPSLEEYQKSEIRQFFQQSHTNLPEVKIGTFGSSFAQSHTSADPTFHVNLQQQLEQVLTPEQLKGYNQSRKEWLDGMASMMGG